MQEGTVGGEKGRDGRMDGWKRRMKGRISWSDTDGDVVEGRQAIGEYGSGMEVDGMEGGNWTDTRIEDEQQLIYISRLVFFSLSEIEGNASKSDRVTGTKQTE